MTAAVPGPVTVIDRVMAERSALPIVTTSPAATRRDRLAPNLVTCSSTTRVVRKLASMRTRVIVRCRMIESQAFTTPTPSSAADHPSSADERPGTSPSSTARDNR